ncbi:MAG: anhydro-N-acetylmuramic acid kinase [Burkholderiales bacterium]
MTARREIFAGVMSGTSLDGVDAVLADFTPGPAAGALLAATHVAFPSDLKRELAALQEAGPDEIVRAARAANALADLYVHALKSVCLAADVAAHDVVAAGVHGQTVRHRPHEGWTLQVNNPARLAERAYMTVVADFRMRDVAAGGQGAPLVPAFHAARFARPGRARVVVNVGGIANVTILPARGDVRGFDTGPGNVLLDLASQRHLGAPYDEGGAWAASGVADAALLAALLDEPFFASPPPKSTGRDLFNAGWLDAALLRAPWRGRAEDLQATLTLLTARTIADAVRVHAPETSDVLVCGGGARNAALMRSLAAALPGVAVDTTESEGVATDHVEALAFAWLAREALAGRPGNLPAVTGAAGPRVLGAIYPR